MPACASTVSNPEGRLMLCGIGYAARGEVFGLIFSFFILPSL
jgi:hypothetical protein